jgi:hypothetical protein
MPLRSEAERLRKVFESTLAWIDRHRSSAATASQVSFIEAMEHYAKSSLRRLDADPNSWEMKKLRARADKLQADVIFLCGSSSDSV